MFFVHHQFEYVLWQPLGYRMYKEERLDCDSKQVIYESFPLNFQPYGSSPYLVVAQLV